MPAEKRTHDEMEQAAKPPVPATIAVAAPAVATTSPSAKPVTDAQAAAASAASATAGMLGLPFMLPSAALMAMSSVQQTDQATMKTAAPPAAAVPAAVATPAPVSSGSSDEVAALQQQTTAALAIASAQAAAAAAAQTSDGGEAKTADLTAQQQQQLVQQQLQLLQMQQQHLQQMSPGDLSAVATMAHQMALGMVMMPMMPLMMMNQGTSTAAAATPGVQSGQSSPQDGQGSPGGSASELGGAAAGDSLGVAADGSTMPLMAGGAFGMGNDDTPKRKRGRPPKKDVLSRGKPEGMEKALKQFPLWGYGMPLPFLPGLMPPGLGAVGDHTGTLAQDDAAKAGEDDPNHAGKAGAKKKTRGTGKPRGRPRTRPRPGEIIRRVKPPPIAPANFPGMQEYLTQKMAEWKATQAGNAADDNRIVGAFGASLLPGEHE